jgi:hypothetical protein
VPVTFVLKAAFLDCGVQLNSLIPASGPILVKRIGMKRKVI